MSERLNTVFYQVMWNRLIAVVEEQAQSLIRTAFSTSVREAGDLSAGVYDLEGRMLAQAVTGTPGHVNAMAAAVAHFINEIGPDNMNSGDVYISNDPWLCTGHLHDITVVTPCFYTDELIGFLASTAHVVDIGGRGFGADAESVYEEGLRIPIMKLRERGELNRSLIDIVRSNVREPTQVVGDIHALANSNATGQKRLLDMLNEFQQPDLKAVADFILDNSRKATLEKIAALPKSKASGSMTIDGYSTPIDLMVSIEIKSDCVICDFAGSSGLDKKGINVPLVYTQAYTCYALKCAIAPEIPNNCASLAPFEICAPINTVVNARHPAPVALRHVIGQMLPDVVYHALDQIIPNTVPAEGASALCNFQLSFGHSRAKSSYPYSNATEVLTFNSGGSGARPRRDGLNATAFPSGVMTMPVESTEHAGPVIIWRKELKSDSGGVGEYRGGLGQCMQVSAIDEQEFDFSAMFDRVDHPARGRRGGGHGTATHLSFSNGQTLRGKGRQRVPAGQRINMEFPGGGGYGDVTCRDEALIRRDLARGYITERAAREDYQLSDKSIIAVNDAVTRGEDI